MRTVRPHGLMLGTMLALAACGEDTSTPGDASMHDAAARTSMDAAASQLDAAAPPDAAHARVDAGPSCTDLLAQAAQAFSSTLSNASRSCQVDADCGHVTSQQWCVPGCGSITVPHADAVEAQLTQTAKPICDAYLAQGCPPTVFDLPCPAPVDDGGAFCSGGQCIEAL